MIQARSARDSSESGSSVLFYIGVAAIHAYTRGKVTRLDLGEARSDRSALVDGILATRVKMTPGRRIDRRRNIAGEDYTLAFCLDLGIGNRYG